MAHDAAAMCWDAGPTDTRADAPQGDMAPTVGVAWDVPDMKVVALLHEPPVERAKTYSMRLETPMVNIGHAQQH